MNNNSINNFKNIFNNNGLNLKKINNKITNIKSNIYINKIKNF